MNIRSGLVLEIQRNVAYIMTSNGEFFKLKIDKNKALPVLGEQYSSRVLWKSFYVHKQV